jgi:membrane fusion protein (multidrug efflux system)
LRVGLSTSASVDVRDESGPQLAPAPPQEPVLATRVYDIDRGEITARIAQIIGENSLAGTLQSSLR